MDQKKNGGPVGEAFKPHGDDIVALFKRWEGLREIAERVLGTHIVLTPSSDGVHIRVSRKNVIGTQTESFLVSAYEVRDANVDIVTLHMLKGIKDVGGFDGLH